GNPGGGSALPAGASANWRRLLAGARKAVLLATGLAVEKHFKDIGEQQELLALMADMVMEYFALESVLLRLEKLGAGAGDWRALAFAVYLPGALERLRAWGRELIGEVTAPAAASRMVAFLDDFCAFKPGGVVAARDRLAAFAIEARGYPRTMK
ncbi:MAG: hypothetical protein JXR89_04960, partial [Deltaproteobacteria bacterium]|nr:hypothetical protein [Deltaproteobacteria bacterium]